MTTKTPDTATVTGRIAWLMQKLWRGSQTEMASYLGVAQGTIANVLSGRRTAGRVLLSKLAAHPLVNDKWLHEGSGSPLLQEASGVGSEIALPIARKLFAGPPADHPECLDEVLYPVARRLYRPSRYWIQIDAAHPFAKYPELSIRVGDWVLIEPDSSNWPDNLRDKACLVDVKSPDGNLLLCCRGQVSTATSKTTHDFDFHDQLPEGIEDCKSLYHEGRFKKSISLDQKARGGRRKPKRLSVKLVAVGVHRCGDL